MTRAPPPPRANSKGPPKFLPGLGCCGMPPRNLLAPSLADHPGIVQKQKRTPAVTSIPSFHGGQAPQPPLASLRSDQASEENCCYHAVHPPERSEPRGVWGACPPYWPVREMLFTYRWGLLVLGPWKSCCGTCTARMPARNMLEQGHGRQLESLDSPAPGEGGSWVRTPLRLPLTRLFVMRRITQQYLSSGRETGRTR